MNLLGFAKIKQCSKLKKEKIKLVIRDSQVLAKLGVVTIFFIGWGGGV